MASEKPQGSVWPLVLIGVVIWFVMQPEKAPQPSPEPVKPTPQSTEWIDANQSELALQLRHIRDTIQKLKTSSPDVDTEAKARAYLAAGRKAARETAWKSVAERDAAVFEDGWTAAKHAERLQQMIGDAKQ